MPTPARPFRRLEIIGAAGKILAGAFLLSLPLFIEVDETGRWIGFGLSAFLILLGLLDLRAARRIDPDGVFLTLDDLDLVDQIAYLRRMIRLLGVLMPLIAGYHAFELYRLETRAAEEVTLVVPVGLVYQNLGFWPAACLFPALTVMGLSVLVVRLRRTERRLAEVEEATDDVSPPVPASQDA